jgi:hypothetical protein
MLVEDAGPPANLGPPPPQVALPPGPIRPVENIYSIVATSIALPRRRLPSPDVSRITSRRRRSASPTTHSRRRDRSNSLNRQRRRDSTSAHGRDARIRDTLFLGAVQQLLPPESTQAAAVSSEDVSIKETGTIPLAPPPGLLVQNAHTAIAPRLKRISPRGRSASPTTPQHRSERRRERSNSTNRQRRDLTSTYNRDTIFLGAIQQLLPAEST